MTLCFVVLFGDLKLASRTFYHCHQVNSTTGNLLRCCLPCFSNKEKRRFTNSSSKLANEGIPPPPSRGHPPTPNTSSQGQATEPGQQEQVLSNAMNNFWKPEQPMAVSEASALPLSMVVSDAVKRWFDDTYRDAQRGDIKQQALLGQMLNEGYGCHKDPIAGAEWIERARRRGYKMDGVYCKL